MLTSALEKKAKSAFYEIYTAEKLEEIKRQSLNMMEGQSRGIPAPSNVNRAKKPTNLSSNRYLILTNDPEFGDIARFPLVLIYDECNNINELKQVIALLQKNLGPKLGENFKSEYQPVNPAHQTSQKEIELQSLVSKLQEDKKRMIEEQKEEILTLGQQIDQLEQEKAEFEERIVELERIIDDMQDQNHRSHAKPNTHEIENLKRQINSLRVRETQALAREQELSHSLKLANNKIKDLMNQSRVNTYTRYVTESVKSKQTNSVKSRPTSVNKSQHSIDSRGYIKKDFSKNKVPPKKITSTIPKPSINTIGSRKYIPQPIRPPIGRNPGLNRSRSVSRKSNDSNYFSPKKERETSKASYNDVTKRNGTSKTRVIPNVDRKAQLYGRKSTLPRDQSSVDLNNSQDDSFEDRRKKFDLKKGEVSKPVRPGFQSKQKYATNAQNKKLDDKNANIERLSTRLAKLRQEARDLD